MPIALYSSKSTSSPKVSTSKLWEGASTTVWAYISSTVSATPSTPTIESTDPEFSNYFTYTATTPEAYGKLSWWSEISITATSLASHATGAKLFNSTVACIIMSTEITTKLNLYSYQKIGFKAHANDIYRAWGYSGKEVAQIEINLPTDYSATYKIIATVKADVIDGVDYGTVYTETSTQWEKSFTLKQKTENITGTLSIKYQVEIHASGLSSYTKTTTLTPTIGGISTVNEPVFKSGADMFIYNTQAQRPTADAFENQTADVTYVYNFNSYTNYGEYTGYISLADPKTYCFGVDSSENEINEVDRTWYIKRRPIDKPTLTGGPWVYNGVPQGPTITCDTTYISYDASSATATNAGKHPIVFSLSHGENTYWKGGKEYKQDDITMSFDIAPVADQIKPSVPESEKIKVYNESSQTLYTLPTSNCFYTAAHNSEQDANSYTATYTLHINPQNHIWQDGTNNSVSIEWSITPKPVATPALDTNKFTYTGEEQKPLATTQTTEWTAAGDLAKVDASDDYWVTFTLNSTNYIWATPSFSGRLPWEIKPQSIAYPTLSGPPFTFTVENAEPKNYTVTLSGDTAKYFNIGGDVTHSDASDNYIATATLKDSKNYIATGTFSGGWSIQKRAIPVRGLKRYHYSRAWESSPYNNAILPATEAEYWRLDPNKPNDDLTQKSMGTYNVYVILKYTESTYWDNFQPSPLTWKIISDSFVKVKTFEANNKSYQDGKDIQLITDASTDTSFYPDVKAKFSTDTNYIYWDRLKASAVGEYTINYYAPGGKIGTIDTADSPVFTKKVSILPYANNITKQATGRMEETYGSEKSMILTPPEATSKQIQYSVSFNSVRGDWSDTEPSFKNKDAGLYTVYYRGNCTNTIGYTDEKNILVTLNPADAYFNKNPEFITELTCTGKPISILKSAGETIPNTSVVKYRVTHDGVIGNWVDTPMVTKCGYHTVDIKIIAPDTDTNYSTTIDTNLATVKVVPRPQTWVLSPSSLPDSRFETTYTVNIVAPAEQQLELPEHRLVEAWIEDTTLATVEVDMTDDRKINVTTKKAMGNSIIKVRCTDLDNIYETQTIECAITITMYSDIKMWASKWVETYPYVYTETGWKAAQLYIWTETGWKQLNS